MDTIAYRPACGNQYLKICKIMLKESEMLEDISVLVVDDFSTMRRIIKKVIAGVGVGEVVEAENGLQAWGILNEKKIDLVICDWNMPEMTGVELLEKVRATDSLAGIPFMMVTAESKNKIEIGKGDERLTTFIPKPFKPKELEAKLRDVLSAHV